ncbi:MAG: hypothetical protein ABEJ70_06090 [Halobacteriaceae archaeon]
MADLAFWGLVALLLVFVFFVYLLVRRTILSFRQGFDDGGRGRS